MCPVYENNETVVKGITTDVRTSQYSWEDKLIEIKDKSELLSQAMAA